MYQRDGWKCRNCKTRNGLDPHHVIYQSAGGPDTLNNLLALCRKCHDSIHAGRLVLQVLRTLETDLEVRFWKRDLWEIYQAAQETSALQRSGSEEPSSEGVLGETRFDCS